ncbi:MAG: PAS domain-containing protein, partial [Alphaproteobacteria bacterium]|nr:PAS domain-containing protein [Alphaproteobacteria bacterium]
AIIALNLAIVIVVSAVFLLYEFQDIEQSRIIAEFHLPAAHLAKSATHELAHLEIDVRGDVAPREGSEADHADAGGPEFLERRERLYALSEIQQSLAYLHQRFNQPRFTEVAGLVDRAFEALFESLRARAIESPGQNVLNAIALLELRLEQLERLNLVAAERLLEQDSAFYDIGERTLLFLFVVLVVSASLVTAGIVRRLEVASGERIEAVGRMRQATGRLAETADRLARAQRIAKIGNWEWDAATTDQWWSDETYRLLGLEPQSAPAGNSVLFETLHESDRGWVQRVLKESEKNGTGYAIKYRTILADGGERILHEIAEPVFNEDGEFTGQRGTLQDITEQFVAEHQVRETAQHLGAALRLARLGTWEWDPEGNTLALSDETASIWGLGSGVLEVSYDEVNSMIHKDDIDEAIALISKTVDTGEPYTYEYRIIRLDGSVRTLIERAERFTDEAGGKILVHGTIQDITESKRIQAELASLNAELEARVEARTAELREAQAELVRSGRLATLGQLTATVSHELRNPLGAMRASMYVVEKRIGAADERVANAIERVNRSITRCDHIIDELLDYTRIRELRVQPTEIDDWLRGVLDEQHVPAGVRIRRKFGAPGLRVPADADRLRRAVINIYDNACQAMSPPWQPAGPGTTKQISIETRVRGDRLEIILADNGPGIPDDLLDKVFEPLFSTKNFGVGLGLPTVHQIMQQHNGGVTVSARRSGGARFALWLPLTREVEAVNT